TETSTFDNDAARPVPWNLRAKPIALCPSFVPRMFSNCSPCLGSTIDVSAVVLNDGLFDADSVVVEFRDPALVGAAIGRAMAGTVVAGNSCLASVAPVTIPYTITRTGAHTVSAHIDPDNHLPETNEDDNSFGGSFSSPGTPAPDLVAAVGWPFAPPQPGDTVRAVEVHVTNQGTAPAAAVQARLTLQGVTLCDLFLGSIGPGQT